MLTQSWKSDKYILILWQKWQDVIWPRACISCASSSCLVRCALPLSHSQALTKIYSSLLIFSIIHFNEETSLLGIVIFHHKLGAPPFCSVNGQKYMWDKRLLQSCQEQSIFIFLGKRSIRALREQSENSQRALREQLESTQNTKRAQREHKESTMKAPRVHL